MRRIEFGGGTYADALTDGRFAVAMADRFITNAREVPFPPSGGVLHHRVGIIDGTFCIAGQGHNDGLAWLWSGDVWRPLGTSYGTSVAAFGPVGVYVSTPNAADNIRIFDINGQQIGAIGKPVGARGIAAITGEGIAPEDVQSVDAWYGHGGLAEYTICAGFLIGQGMSGGLVIKHDAGQPSIIEPGHVEFCRARDGEGQVFAVATWKTQERKAVICWFDRRDLLSMPRVQPLIDPPPSPPPPDPEPEPNPVSIPNRFDAVKAADSMFPHLLKTNTAESCGEFTERVVLALHAADPNWGHVGKRPGQTQHNGHAVDAVMYKTVPDKAIDIIGGAENHPTPGTPAWMEVTSGGQPWMAPVPVGDTPPDPEPDPPPSGDDWKQEAQAIRELVRALRLEVLGQLERLQVCEGKADGAQSAGLIAYQKLVTIEERLRKGLPVQGNIGRSLGHAHGFSGKTQWTD
jgi:hypothetical protein